MYSILAILVIAAILYYSINYKDKDEQNFKSECDYYFKNSVSFRRVIEQNGWYDWDLSKKNKISLLKSSKQNQKVQEELKESKILQQSEVNRQKEKQLFIFNNIDMLLETFGQKQYLSRNEIIEQFIKKIATLELCNHHIEQMIKYGCLAPIGSKSLYSINVAKVHHPYKLTAYGDSVTISLQQYISLINKAEWRL